MSQYKKSVFIVLLTALATIHLPASGDDSSISSSTISYRQTLTRIEHPDLLLADYPDFVEPLQCETRFLAPPVVDDDKGSLRVRSWRYSYTMRGIVEMTNRLDPKATAVMNVHLWGCDDGHGLRTPEPNGVLLFCTPEKNAIGYRHTMEIINPFLRKMRPDVAVVAHSLPGIEDPIRKKLYPSISTPPSELAVAEGEKMLAGLLAGFPFRGRPLITELTLDRAMPLPDYFRQTDHIDAGDYYNGPGFWNLPIPLLAGLDFGQGDIVIYDDEGYEKVRDYLKSRGVRHILMTGHLTDVCVTHTTCGFLNMSRDFNVFLVGDATLASFPASATPRFATQAALADVSLNLMITQISWITLADEDPGR